MDNEGQAISENLSDKVMNKTFSRRTFLKGTTYLSVLAMLDSAAGPGDTMRVLEQVPASASAPALEQWIPTACNMCGGQTGILAKVDGAGLVTKIEPNSLNPIGVANISSDFAVEKARGGRMCPKGNSGLKTLYDPDRLTTPVRRIRGSDKWEGITWQEAIDYVAARLQEIKTRYGPESLVWFSEDHSFTHVQQDFCLAYGTPNYHNHSNLCDVSRKAGFRLAMGDDRPLADFQNTKYMLLFGWNPLSATKWAHLPAIIMRGLEKGAKLVVVDPVFNATAAKADEWVPIRPGTDAALALAMAQVIISENLYDKEFVESWTVGFEEYARYVRTKTPEWAERITTVPAATIRRLARELAGTKPALIDAWSGPAHHTNATHTIWAIAALAGLLGQVDKPGTMMVPEKKGSKHRAPWPEWGTIKAPRLDGRGTKYPLAHSSGIYVEAVDAILSSQPYQARAGVFVFQNFVMAVPNTQKVMEAMKKLEFIVVVDTFMSETAMMADVVIPGTHYLERYDLNSNWVTFPSLSLRQPVIKPLYGIMPEYDFVMALAKKMGFKGFDMSYEDYLDAELKGGLGIGLAQLKALPGAIWIGGETRYEKFKTVLNPEQLAGASIEEKTGTIRDKSGKAIGVVVDGQPRLGFNTPSRKFHFTSKDLEDKGFPGLPEYFEPEDKPSLLYPFYMVNWKETEHTQTRTFNNPWLMEIKPTNPLWMNIETGKELGFREGDRVIIESPYGKDEATLHLTPGCHPAVVGLMHGYGHWGFGKVARGKGTADNQFLPGKAERLSGQAVTKEVAVRVYKA